MKLSINNLIRFGVNGITTYIAELVKCRSNEVASCYQRNNEAGRL